MNSRHPGRSRPARPILRAHKAVDVIAGPLRFATSTGPLARRLRFEPLEPRRVLAAITVTTLADTIDFTDGQTSLREAIFAANTVPGSDEITFAPALTAAGPATIHLTHGELRITDSLTLTGPGADLLAIDASASDPTPDQDNNDGSRILVFDDGDVAAFSTMSVAGLTLTGADVYLGFVDGGAIHNRENLSVVDCRITGNAATYGAGIDSRYGALTVQRSLISHNRAQQSAGIGAFGVSLTIDASTITDNVADRRGGGVGATVQGPVLIKNTQITGNRAVFQGAGLFRMYGQTTITGSTISDNILAGHQNIGGEGGGVFGWLGTMEIVDSTITGNEARRGGGVYTRHETFTLLSSTVSGNRAQYAGGIHIAQGATSPDQVAKVAILHSTITANRATSAPSAGGVEAGAGQLDLVLANSIIADNQPAAGGFADIYLLNGVTLTASYSLLGDQRGSGLAESPLGAPDANGNLIGGPLHGVIDPLIAPLADNGGPTLTHALLPGSPALNAGDPMLLAGVGDTPQFDQRGEPFSRIAGARIDIGAFEQFVPALRVDSLDDAVDGDYRPGRLTLREAIELANHQPGPDEITFAHALFANGPATILLNHGELEVTDALAIIGNGGDLLTVDAQQQSRVFNITATSGDFSISRLTVTGGRTVGDNASNDTSQSGGGIRSRTTGAFVLDAVAIVNNETYGAGAYGGGVYAATLTIHNSAIIGNAAKNAGGGGLHALTLVMEHCVVSGNSTIPESQSDSRSEGGGISAGTATISNSEIFQNTARGLGGGIFCGRLTLSRSTIRDNYSFFGGGGIRAVNDSTIRDSIISGNTGDYGGGIRFSERLTIERSSVLNNVANNREGGGIYGDNVLNVINCIIAGNSTIQAIAPGGGIYSRGAVTIRNSEISNNRTAGAKSPGGGIFGGDVVIHNSVIADNETLGDLSPGGGLYATGRATLDRVTVRNNRTSGNDSPGAGIASGRGSSAATFVTDSVITFNETVGARSHGGGISSLVLAVTDVLVAENHATGLDSNGGGIAATSVTATNVTLSSNTAAGSGGGVFITSLGNVNRFAFTTIADNKASVGGGGVGGGLFVTSGSAEFNNSLVTRNADAGGTSNVAGDFTINFSMVGGGEEFLAPLADNGGPTLPGGAKLLTHALLPGSPALNAGDPAFAPGLAGAPEFDQRGAPFTRLAGPRIDIGAFESQAPDGALDADFDFSGRADGHDFLAWQRNFGKPTAATYRQGDATADGDVDSADFAVWKSRFGASAASQPLALVAPMSISFESTQGPAATERLVSFTPPRRPNSRTDAIDAALTSPSTPADTTPRRSTRPHSAAVDLALELPTLTIWLATEAPTPEAPESVAS